MDSFQIFVLVLFGVMLMAVTASYAWYNVQFVQHQEALFLLGAAADRAVVALGWRLFQPLAGRHHRHVGAGADSGHPRSQALR